ncbi:MAG: PUTATIVE OXIDOREDUCTASE [uncultured Nocardioidaceae bacterium]|uniref:PUTATIVE OXIDOREDUCTASE n=1 Tax=uncultured Nocardioidaceae bacterium TaxID=253824 RepID=A0A6J4MNN4_9ACTN|nr:MAG: PUTATIVE OXIDOREDUCTASE [uncultured Nocardioidaceae bacterium]
MSRVLVVGGGPVGLATALHAARAGADVTVWERRAGVLDKACGEGLMPAAVAALDELGVTVPGVRLEGIDYLDGTRRARARFPAGGGLGVRRTALHDALRAAAAAAGIRTEHRRLTRLTQEPEGVVADGEHFDWLVGADGLHSTARRLCGLDGARPGLRRYGLRGHVRVQPWSPFVEVHWGSGAEVYVTPVAADLVGVTVLTSRRASFAEQLDGFPALRRLADRSAGAVLGAGPLWQRSRRRVRGRVLLVGDAAGYVDALTGEGIALGLAQARAAVAAIGAGDPERYEAEWRSLTATHRRLTGALVTATRTGLARRLVVPTAARLPALFGTVVAGLAAPAPVPASVPVPVGVEAR